MKFSKYKNQWYQSIWHRKKIKNYKNTYGKTPFFYTLQAQRKFNTEVIIVNTRNQRNRMYFSIILTTAQDELNYKTAFSTALSIVEHLLTSAF